MEHYVALYVLSNSKRLRSLRSQICLYGPNQTMSWQDSETGLLPIPGQLKDSPAREFSDSLLFNDGRQGGREGGREGHCWNCSVALFIIMSK